MIIDEEKLFLGFLLIAYILLGGFFGWLLGTEPGTFAWAAVIILWPVIGSIFFVCGLLIAGIVASIFSR